MTKTTHTPGCGPAYAPAQRDGPGTQGQSLPAVPVVPKSEWFCIRSKLKQERTAAASLHALPDIEVFCPRIRFQRQTRRGKIWFEEALFPGYLFARFELERMFKAVNCARGVAGLIKFGASYPSIPAAEVESLRTWFVGQETKTIVSEPQVGQTSTIVDGPFKGLTAVVSRLMPGAQRVAVLLEVLGRQSEVLMRVSDLALAQRRGELL